MEASGKRTQGALSFLQACYVHMMSKYMHLYDVHSTIHHIFVRSYM